MAIAKQHKARTNIYRHGLRVPADNKQGYKTDRTQPNPEGDEIMVNAGQTYWRWQQMNGPLEWSTTEPSRQTLTSNPLLKKIYDLEDKMAEYTVRGNAWNDITAMGLDLKGIWVAANCKMGNNLDELNLIGKANEYANILIQTRRMMNELAAIRNGAAPGNVVDVWLIEDKVRKVKFDVL